MRISDWSSDVCSSDLEDEARGVMFHRPAKDWPRINYELVHRSALHLLIGNQPANAIQKEDTEGFILERAIVAIRCRNSFWSPGSIIRFPSSPRDPSSIKARAPNRSPGTALLFPQIRAGLSFDCEQIRLRV